MSQPEKTCRSRNNGHSQSFWWSTGLFLGALLVLFFFLYLFHAPATEADGGTAIVMVLGAVLSLVFSAILRRMGWIRENDLKLEL